MKTQWIVENLTNEPSYLELVEAIKKEGCPLKEIKGDFKYSDLEGLNWEAPVLFFGSIEMTNTAFNRMGGRYHPIAYCDQRNYLCTKYMSHYGKYLFNDKYAIVSLGELQRQKFFFFGVFGKEALIFIRPDSGQKPFQAQLLDLLDLDRFCDTNKHLLHELVIVSSPKTIIWEGRFIVSHHKDIISYSTYRFQGQVTKIPSVPPQALATCKTLLDVGYYPDNVFCLDLCQDADGNFWLLELNSFSSAGLYASDKSKIVRRVGEIAEEDWSFWRKNSVHS